MRWVNLRQELISVCLHHNVVWVASATQSSAHTHKPTHYSESYPYQTNSIFEEKKLWSVAKMVIIDINKAKLSHPLVELQAAFSSMKKRRRRSISCQHVQHNTFGQLQELRCRRLLY